MQNYPKWKYLYGLDLMKLLVLKATWCWSVLLQLTTLQNLGRREVETNNWYIQNTNLSGLRQFTRDNLLLWQNVHTNITSTSLFIFSISSQGFLGKKSMVWKFIHTYTYISFQKRKKDNYGRKYDVEYGHLARIEPNTKDVIFMIQKWSQYNEIYFYDKSFLKAPL